MADETQKNDSFKCRCGQTFKTVDEYREHRKTHEQLAVNARAGAATAGAGHGTQKATAVGQEQGETRPGDNQKGREESQQGWREASNTSKSDGETEGRQDWREAKNRPDGRLDQVPQVGDEHEWKHGKQEDDTQNEMTDDWGKSDKH